jgi:hypothetical protein
VPTNRPVKELGARTPWEITRWLLSQPEAQVA